MPLTVNEKRLGAAILGRMEANRALAANASSGVQHLRQRVDLLESRLAQVVRANAQLEQAVIAMSQRLAELEQGRGR